MTNIQDVLGRWKNEYEKLYNFKPDTDQLNNTFYNQGIPNMEKNVIQKARCK